MSFLKRLADAFGATIGMLRDKTIYVAEIPCRYADIQICVKAPKSGSHYMTVRTRGGEATIYSRLDRDEALAVKQAIEDALTAMDQAGRAEPA